MANTLAYGWRPSSVKAAGPASAARIGSLPAGQGQLADGAAALQPAVRLAQVRRVDRAQHAGQGGAQLAGLDQAADPVEDAVLADHVRGAEARPRKHEFPVDADALGLVRVADAQRAGRLHDQ